MAPETKLAPARRETAPNDGSPEQPLPADHHEVDAQRGAVGGVSSLAPGQNLHDDQQHSAGGSPSFSAQCGNDTQRTPGADTPGHRQAGAQRINAGGSSLSTATERTTPMARVPSTATDDQRPFDTQVRLVVGGDPLPPAFEQATPNRPAPGDDLADDQRLADSHGGHVVGPSANVLPTPKHETPGDPVYDALRADAEALDGIETVRIATENRLRTMLPDSPEATRTTTLLAGLKDLEKHAVRNLEKTLKGMPLGAWIQSTPGIGLKQGARLLAAIGDPATRANPAKLWRYAGLDPVDGKARERRKGEFAGWNPDAKMRAFLVAESCLKAKARSPYGPLYDHERAKHTGAVHLHECRRCGPKGRPAQPGSALSDGHGHARALRRVAKEVLKDMWRMSRVEES